MSNLAEKIEYEEAFVEAGTVLAAEGGAFLVRAGSRRLSAARATSCLLSPEAGDRVLVAAVGGEHFVLAVLSRAPGAASRLVVDGDLELRVAGGRFAVAAQDGIDLTTAADTTMTSKALNVSSLEANVVVRRLSMLGALVECEIDKLKTVAGQVDSIVERLHQKVKRSYRFIEEFEHLRAEHFDYRARQTARVHAENTVITAQQVVKVDGAQVHIG